VEHTGSMECNFGSSRLTKHETLRNIYKAQWLFMDAKSFIFIILHKTGFNATCTLLYLRLVKETIKHA